MATQKDQWFAYYIEKMGYLKRETLQSILNLNIPLETYLKQHSLLSATQILNIRSLYIEHFVLNYAHSSGQFSPQQCESILNKKIEALHQGQTRTLFLLEQKLFSLEQYKEITKNLYMQKVIGQEEIEFLQMAIDKQHSTIKPSTSSMEQSSVDIKIGDIFHHYRIQKVLGKGGMGVVYKALDTKLERMVALKVISSNYVTEKDVRRFIQETKAIAQLEHSNIVKLFEVGDQPQNYFTMEYIEGSDFTHLIKNSKLSFKELTAIVVKAADALFCAHQKKIIHRDIKPSNIMITEFREPKVMDFGLAKFEDTKLSRTGDTVGTPAYMSPEQANCEEVDTRTDIYSLGATLYEALTGRPPYQGRSYLNILHQIFHTEPLAPRKIDPEIPMDLEVICLKSLEKERAKRYQTAKEFQEDLERFLQHKPIKARPPGFFEKITKWCYRNAVAASLLFLVGVSALLALWLFYTERQTGIKLAKTTNQLKMQTQELGTTNTQLQKAKKQKEEALNLSQTRLKEAKKKLAFSYLKMAQYQISVQNFHQAAIESLKAYKIFYNDSNNRLNQKQISFSLWYSILPNLPRKAQKISFPGREHILSQNATKLALRQGKKIHYWNIEEHFSGKRLLNESFVVEEKEADGKMCFSHDNRLFAFCHQKGVTIYDTQMQQVIQNFAIAQAHLISALAFSIDNKWMIMRHRSNMIWGYVKNGKTKGFFMQVQGSKRYTICTSYNNLVAVSNYTGVEIWDIKSRKKVDSIALVGPTIVVLKFSPDNRLLLFGTTRGRIYIYNLNHKTLFSLQAHEGDIRSAIFTSLGRIFATCGEDGKIILWDTVSRKRISVLTLEGRLMQLGFVKNKYIVATAYDKNRIFYHKWRIEPYLLQRLKLPKDAQGIFKGIKNSLVNLDNLYKNPIVISKKGRFIAFSQLLAIFLWDTQKNTNHFVLPRQSYIYGDVGHVSFSPNEKLFAAIYRNKKIVIRNTENCQQICEIQMPKKSDTSTMRFPTKSSQIIFNQDPGGRTLAFYNFSQKNYIKKIQAKSHIRDIQISPNEKWIALAEASHVEIIPLTAMGSSFGAGVDKDIYYASWHPSNNIFASGSRDGDVVIWQRQKENSWKILKKFSFLRNLKALSFSPEGRLAICFQSQVKIYDLDTKQLIPTAIGYFKSGTTSFAPNWSYFALPSIAGEVLIFSLNKEKKILSLSPQLLQQAIGIK